MAGRALPGVTVALAHTTLSLPPLRLIERPEKPLF